jgi:hypothetical protein
MVELEINGWSDNEEEYTNVPRKCPKCGGDLWKTDALRILNELVVGCKDTRCRWVEIYTLPL